MIIYTAPATKRDGVTSSAPGLTIARIVHSFGHVSGGLCLTESSFPLSVG